MTTYDGSGILGLEVHPKSEYVKIAKNGAAAATFATISASGSIGTLDSEAAGEKYFYLMRGRDANATGVVYRSWVVTFEPDYTGQYYTGTYSGGSLNLTGVAVVSKWKK